MQRLALDCLLGVAGCRLRFYLFWDSELLRLDPLLRVQVGHVLFQWNRPHIAIPVTIGTIVQVGAARCLHGHSLAHSLSRDGVVRSMV